MHTHTVHVGVIIWGAMVADNRVHRLGIELSPVFLSKML